ncbi:MAG TPA: alpha/beta fold hydrolase [Bacteroidota bacterium]|nr:alpha/beta fold hydrolase [Bacteroidota bacterium]
MRTWLAACMFLAAGTAAAGAEPLREGYVPVKGARLFFRETGSGPPIIVIHGGPDFDMNYLLPDMDRLAGRFHLVYYDQRGRGKSAAGVRPEDVSLESEVSDLDTLRKFLHLKEFVLLGHSWGGVLAAAYAARHPGAVSRLILLNTAPLTHDDFLLLRAAFSARRPPADATQMRAIASGEAFRMGNADTVAAYYRLHFRMTVRDTAILARLVQNLGRGFTPDGILKARAIEDRLRGETWLDTAYDALRPLSALPIPTLVMHGDYDFIPVECAAHAARVMPGARLVVLKECGHFAYMEKPEEVRREITNFLK